MPINYRRVNPNAHAADVMKQRATEMEVRAFQAEIELLRLRRVLEVDPTDAKAAEALIKQPGEVKSWRSKATRAAGAAPLEVEEIIAVREEFLNTWIEGIEKDHAAQAALLAEAKRLQGLKGKDALTRAERQELEAEIPAAKNSLAILEAVHEIAATQLDALRDHPDAILNGQGTEVVPRVADEVLGKP